MIQSNMFKASKPALRAHIDTSTSILSRELFSWSSDHLGGLNVMILASHMLFRHYDDISQALIDAAIVDLNSNDDCEASAVALKLDRWYREELIAFRIYST